MKRWQGCVALSVLLLVSSQIFAVEIIDCKVIYDYVALDCFKIQRLEVFLEGVQETDYVVFTIKNNKFKEEIRNGKATLSWIELQRKIGQGSFVVHVAVRDFYGELLAEKSFALRLPIIAIGETVQNVKDSISWTPLWWKESSVAVYEASEGEYYAVAAKQNMKFIILAFEFRNNGRSPEETPYLSYGRIATSKWHIFPIWQGSGKRRRATEKEVSELIGSSGGYEELLPGKTTVGCVVFEIPKDEEPIEIKISGVPSIISLGKKPPTPEEVAKEEMRSLLKSLSQRFPDLEPDELLTLFNELLKELWPSWEEG